jgi:serine phosphatase RsbU (regulator of sigma subunit)
MLMQECRRLFIYRKESNAVEEIILNGMPLGAMKNFPYEIKETEISSGDTILIAE